jgi:Predicted membrane protein
MRQIIQERKALSMGGIIHSSYFIFLVYLLIINIYGFSIMGIDKRRAKKNMYRIPERVLFTVAFIGGSAGVLTGMKSFHHKTLHNKFRYGIPALLILNIIAAGYILFRFNH